MIITPKVRGFICTTTHPAGCEANVRQQIAYIKSKGELEQGPKRVLVIGASTGYGLSSRITAAFGSDAATIGVFCEKPGTDKKTGSAGWYNAAAFDKAAKEAGLYAKSINGDAFSNECRDQVIKLIKQDLGQIDLVVYSLASPVRKLPDTGEVIRSALKPIGEVYKTTAIDTNKDVIVEAEVEPATDEEIASTIKVMGGEDWKLWIEALDKAGVLTQNFKTVAYSYLGPKVTYGIYKEGTIGAAKRDLESTSNYLNDYLKKKYNGEAYVSLSKALMTKASAVIPIFPLYATLLYKVMKEKGIHEGTIEQKQRLFKDMIYGNKPELDSSRRLRPDNWEMREDVQSEVEQLWDKITPENFKEIGDYKGVREEFMQLNGFDFDNVDYLADINLEELSKLKP